MRIWIIGGVSLLVGAIAGWIWTAAEMGVTPAGNGEVEFGAATAADSAQPAPGGALPKLGGLQREFNFGHIELGGIGRHSFEFKNEGRGPLTLTKGESSCVCTVADIAHPTAPPGGSTTVEVQWHPSARGSFRQTVQVLTNDPQHPRVELVIVGEVVSSYVLSQQTIVFSSVDPNRGATAETDVYSFDTDDLKIIDPELIDKSLSKFYEFKTDKLAPDELSDEKGAKSGCKLAVTVKPGLPAGPFGERIRFHLNSPGKPEVTVEVEGNVAGPVGISGPNWDDEHQLLTLGTIRSREGLKAQLLLTVRSDNLASADFRVASIAPKTLHVHVGKLEKLGSHTGHIPLTIEIPPGTPPEDHLGTEIGPLAKILLDTGLPEDKQLKILVRYAVED